MKPGDKIVVTHYNESFAPAAKKGMKGIFLNWTYDGSNNPIAYCRFVFGTYYMRKEAIQPYFETPFEIDLHDYLQSELG